ncbi:MAG: M4 family metallopeptidase [Bacteroidales bacterium]|nr:M4 family metallopeptidase [Bacteroidales bacterium]
MRTKLNFKLLLLIGIFASVSLYAQKTPITNNFNSPFWHKKNTSKNQSVLRPTVSAKHLDKTENEKIIRYDNSFIMNFYQKKSLSRSNAIEKISEEFNLDEKSSFALIKSETCKLGIIHSKYQRKYNDIPIEGDIIILHEKNGIVLKANGQITEINSFSATPSINSQIAKEIAKNYVTSKKILSISETDLVILNFKNENILSYKIRIDALNPISMSNIFVDAETGKIINTISLISESDVTGTAETYYSGTQNITTDSYSAVYRLRESSRNIHTYNATNDTDFVENVGFTNPQDFYDADNNWLGVPYLSSLTISDIASDWWHTFLADESPDLYIIIRDGYNNIVYTNYSNYINNTYPPVTINNINLFLTNPPYTFELWDYDSANDDDYGGTYSLNTSTGYHTFSGFGNYGSYSVSQLNNPATDVHWGMEMTYDYYMNIHSRNSFDNAGATIRNFINPTIFFEQNPNNALAMGAPYNIMCYGMGDGSYMNPVVGLDVAAHEFTHMVTNNSAQLIYQGESGALNEAFSDIFGAAVEFYSGVNTDWYIGEGIMIQGSYMRNMGNPNDRNLPDTYEGNYWVDVSNTSQDHGGVHTNCGVMSYWFYLICEGGSGTNDIGNTYNVPAIGILKAEQIAYRNLTVYLTPSATHYDAMQGSLQAAEDLYGYGSSEYIAVQEAWYAVGIGDSPFGGACTGLTVLYEPSGAISDGSGSGNYQDYADCTWSIQPTGANTITLEFTSFDTEAQYDSVMVYDGPNENYPLLMTWWGNTIPPTITSSTGALFVQFLSDEYVNYSGWSAEYTSSGTAYCDGGNYLTDASGSFNDGSASNNYGNNQFCYWLISPPCANSIILSFSSFDTEQDYDGVIVYDGNNTDAPELGVFTGSTIPNNVTSSGSEMLVVFVSDFMINYQGFSANYTSTGTPYCSGTSTATYDAASFSDGSGADNYCNNLECSWLIQPPDATSISLVFEEFDLEMPYTDGTMYDYVEVFDGTNDNAPSLGKFSGNNIPPLITSTTGSMYVKFSTDFSVTSEGWSAYYYCTTNNYCSGNTVLTNDSGYLSDGSDANMYGNNADCSWLIQPNNAESITLTFSEFETEEDYDGVIIYDGEDETAPMLGSFTGSTLPEPITSTGGSMYVSFVSDYMIRDNGWSASYTSCIASDIPTMPNGETELCENSSNSNYSTTNTANAVTYIWDLSPVNAGSIIGDGINATVEWNDTFTGNAIVKVKGVNDCENESDFSEGLLVNINQLPETPTITQNGNTLESSFANEYQWYELGNLIPGAIYQTFTPSQDGEYTVLITDANGCSSESLPFDFIMTSLLNNSAFGVNVFPNPTTGEINVTGENIYKIDITNVEGQILKCIHVDSYNTKIDLSPQSKGVYIMKIHTVKGSLIKKIVLK